MKKNNGKSSSSFAYVFGLSERNVKHMLLNSSTNRSSWLLKSHCHILNCSSWASRLHLRSFQAGAACFMLRTIICTFFTRASGRPVHLILHNPRASGRPVHLILHNLRASGRLSELLFKYMDDASPRRGPGVDQVWIYLSDNVSA